IVQHCHARLVSDLRLPTQADPAPLTRIVYEDKALESLLSAADQELLAPGYSALLADHRDSAARWREVLADLGQSRVLTPTDALQIFDQAEYLKEREPRWFV